MHRAVNATFENGMTSAETAEEIARKLRERYARHSRRTMSAEEEVFVLPPVGQTHNVWRVSVQVIAKYFSFVLLTNEV